LAKQPDRTKKSGMKSLMERRQRAVQLRLAGASISQAQKDTGLARHTVINALRSYQAGGWAAVEAVRPGRPQGAGRLLSVLQEAQLREWICTVAPDHLGLPHPLWSNQVVRELIQERFGLELADRTMALYLKRWGFALRHPLERFLRTSDAYDRGLSYRRVHPSEAKHLHQAGATLLWCDWQALPEGDTASGSDGPARVPRSEPRRIVLYAITTRGEASWRCYRRLNGTSTIHFFEALSRSSSERVGLFVMGTRIPEPAPLRRWLRNNSKVLRFTLDHGSIGPAVEEVARSRPVPVPVPVPLVPTFGPLAPDRGWQRIFSHIPAVARFDSGERRPRDEL
jgi:transposase